MKKIAVVLSGCGHMDGAEITESVSLLISLNQFGAKTSCFAPSIDFTPINHISHEPMKSEKRNSLIEAARIARGQIKDLTQLHAKDFDGIAFAGGFGAAKLLSNWAEKGSQSDLHPEIKRIILEFYKAEKPIAAVCIAPTLLAKALGTQKVEVTIGEDSSTAEQIEKTGACHVQCPVGDYVTDREHKLITTPAYMYNALPHEVFKGISGLAKELVEMA